MDIKNEAMLLEGLKQLDLNHDKQLIEKLNIYLNIYMDWNKKISLSSIRDEKEIIIRHFLDSLSPIPFLKKEKLWGRKSKAVDLGSGGGFPGVIFKIINPELRIDLAEVNKKKICFLNEVVLNLALSRVGIVDSSIGKVNREYEILFARAFGSLQKIIHEARIYIKKGFIISYKGKEQNALNEINDLSAHYKNNLILTKIKTPFLEEERTLIIIQL